MKQLLSVGHDTKHLIHAHNHHNSFERHILSAGSMLLTWGMSLQKWPQETKTREEECVNWCTKRGPFRILNKVPG